MKIKGRDPRYDREYEIEVIYYDSQDLLIINKPFNVRIDGDTSNCPTSKQFDLKPTIVEYYLKLNFPQFKKHYLIHQLDYVTSGIHCWGLSKEMAGGKSFMMRLPTKTYTALVKGHLELDEFEINKPIAEDLTRHKLMCIGNQENPGKDAQTLVKVLKRGFFESIPVTHVQLHPHTGRRHQLRVHLNSMGHPIIGDISYENPLTDFPGRTMLHAWKLTLPIPQKDQIIELETADPFVGLVQAKPKPQNRCNCVIL